MKNDLIPFEDYKIRRSYDETTETWYFSIVDIIQILTQQPDFQTARNYWKVLKNRLNKEGSESVTKCNRLKLEAADGKKYLTDVADVETSLRLIQSIPSPKAEPIKLWLAKVGYERIQEMADPEKSLDRARETWQNHGIRSLLVYFIAQELLRSGVWEHSTSWIGVKAMEILSLNGPYEQSLLLPHSFPLAFLLQAKSLKNALSPPKGPSQGPSRLSLKF